MYLESDHELRPFCDKVWSRSRLFQRGKASENFSGKVE